MQLEKTYLKPTTVQQAIEMAVAWNDFKYLAGGTDVIVNKFQGNETAGCLIDITGIDILKKIEVTDDKIIIGALVTLEELDRVKILKDKFPALLQAAKSVATPVIRKTATLGGNVLCENRCVYYNQSEWWREAAGRCLKCDGDICIASGGPKICFSKSVSDMAPVLIVCDAEVIVEDQTGEYIFPLEYIYTGDGLRPNGFPKSAILKSIVLYLDEEFRCIFKKLRPRESVDFTSLTTAVSLSNKGQVKIAIGGLDPMPVVITGRQENDPATFIQKAMKKSRVVDNDVYSRKYRREMLLLYLQRSFEELGLHTGNF
jgi:4-hydroxybenzoyl-CoA reductase subunit beta